MPWYYAGADSKPTGPLSLEELQARRLNGTISPETHVIEHTGQPGETLAWKRYREVFPANPVLPPIPPHLLNIPVPPAAISPLVSAPHPLFPSAVGTTRTSVFPPGNRPDPHHQVKPTNSWCGWGFGLGLAGFFFSFACGVGLLLAIPAFFISIVGLVQVHHKREQSGQTLAIAGLLLSGVALLVSVVLIVTMTIPLIKQHSLTVTEQTTNDSD